MAILLQAPLFEVIGLERTELSAASVAGATTLTVDSTEGFVANDYIIVGNLNTEKTEIVKITTVSSTTGLTVPALDYAHVVDSPIRKTPYNQIKFYRSTTETGTYTSIATETMEVDNISGLTLYNDSTGTTSSWYKFTYYNSNSGLETTVADSLATKGGYTLYCSLEDVYRIMHFKVDKSSRPREETVLMLIEGRSSQFNRETGSIFVTTEIGSTSDYNYVDGREGQLYYPLGYAPIVSITAIDSTQTSAGSTSSWDSLTVGRDNDYILNKEAGTIEFTSQSSKAPPSQPQAIRWYGTYGYASIPDDVRNAVAKGVAADLASSAVYRAFFKGTDGFTPDQIDRWNKDWDMAVMAYKRDKIILV